MMLKIKKILILLFLFFLFGNFVFAQSPNNNAEVYFFYKEGCPYCEEMKLFLAKLTRNNSHIIIHPYEVGSDENNQALLSQFASAYNKEIDGVPALFIGEKLVEGNYPLEVESAIKECLISQCVSPMGKVNARLQTFNHSGDEISKMNFYIKIRWAFIILALIFLGGVVFVFKDNKGKA